MKILHIIDNLQGGGKERRLIQLCNGLVESGISSSILILENINEYQDSIDSKVEVYCLSGNYKNYINAFLKINTLLKQINPDIVQVWSPLITSSIATFSAKLNNIKVIGSYITVATPMRYTNKLYIFKLYLKRACDKIVTNSYAGLKSYGINNKKGSVIYNGFDLNRFNKLNSIANLINDLGIEIKFLCIMVARFDKAKDYETYLEAACSISQTKKDIAFLCLGQGPDLDFLSNKYMNYKNIVFLGFKENSLDYINASNIGILCTNNKVHLEGVSNSLIEYMFLKKPVIATSGGGSDEIVINDYNGYLIEPYNAAELAKKILLLYNNSNKCSLIGKNAYEFALNNFSLKDKVNEYKKIYDSVL